MRVTGLLLFLAFFAGCVPTYKLVSGGQETRVNNELAVVPKYAWNKSPRQPNDPKQVQHWTKNGPALDLVTLISGIEDGKSISEYKKRDEERVPEFRSNMTPPELTAMLDAYYRITRKATAFAVTNIEPTQVSGHNAIQIEFDFVGVNDLNQKGKAVVFVIDERLYGLVLQGAEIHYFPAIVAEFDALIMSAKI